VFKYDSERLTGSTRNPTVGLRHLCLEKNKKARARTSSGLTGGGGWSSMELVVRVLAGATPRATGILSFREPEAAGSG